jgi:diguanylate cyclase (GGDEF)-like protein
MARRTNTLVPTRPALRVLALALVLAAVSVTVSLSVLRGLDPVSRQTAVPWWALAIGFLCTEVLVIHLDVRRDTYSISAMELPLVVGLFFVSPIAVLIARLTGTVVALVLHRRQAPLKAFFNLTLYAAETIVAITVFRFLAGTVGDVDQQTWLAAFAAMLAANIVSLGGVTCAMWLHGAELEGRVRAMLIGALIPPIANTSLALGAVALLWDDPRSVWLLAGTAIVLVVAYRAFAALNQRYANLQRLYDFTRRLQATDSETVIVEMLAAARELLRAESAQLVIVDGSSHVRLWALGREPEADERVALDQLSAYTQQAITDGRPAVVGTTRADDVWHGCMVVPIVTDGTVVAVMTVADRADDVSTFDHDDLRLFETLVNHAAIALDNAQLVGRLRHDALHDALTGLPNRALFNTCVDDAVRARRPGTKLAVMLMDLDRFKEVNDTLGHHCGDQLLCEVGRRLEQVMPAGGAIARLGGDEFALLLPSIQDAEDAVTEARRVRALLEAPFMLGHMHVDVGGTIGIAVSPDHGEDPATLLQRADVAMYAAKSGGGIEVYASERDHYSPRRLALLGELRDAIDHGQLVLHYQPKINVVTGAPVGAEALLRWPHPERGMIPPDEFVPIAEHTGVIRSLTLYVLRRALADCALWRTTGSEVGVAVNVSARNLLDLDLVDDLRALLAATELPANLLTLEITESSIMGDTSRTLHVLDDLAALGVRISIDDFGTGYSSLTYLKQLPVDEVKIDKSFVATMHTDPGDAAIVRSVIDLGANLGLTVVAEGVETDTALALLRELGCPLAQGYFVSRPVPLAAFTEWLATNGHATEVIPLRRPERTRVGVVSR